MYWASRISFLHFRIPLRASKDTCLEFLSEQLKVIKVPKNPGAVKVVQSCHVKPWALSAVISCRAFPGHRSRIESDYDAILGPQFSLHEDQGPREQNLGEMGIAAKLYRVPM